jgi:hypothetical protein
MNDSTATKTTLGEFTKCLVASLHKAEIEMPLRDERFWHTLFYELKSSAADQLSFLHDLRFDWDGPYPKSQELSRFLHALHWNAGVAALNPRFTTIQLDDALADRWTQKASSLEPQAQAMLKLAVDRAKPKLN